MPGPSVNLLASLRPQQVSVTIAGQRFVLSATDAASWIGALALDPKSLYGIMPGLITDDDLEAMEQLMAQHPDIDTRWLYAARTALGRAGGRDWWWCANLTRKALGAWTYINGSLLRQNIHTGSVSYADWLDACYTMLWSGSDEEHRLKLDLELQARPAGVAVAQSRTATRQMLAEFAAD